MSIMLDLLDDPRIVSIRIATTLGIPEAFVIGQLHYWLKFSTTKTNGKNWVYNTLEQWVEILPFYSKRTIQRTLANLKNLGIVQAKCLSKDVRNRILYYTLDYKKLDSIIPTGHHSCGQFGNPLDANLETSIHNNTHKITHKITSKDKNILAESENMTELSELSKKEGIDSIKEHFGIQKPKEPLPPKNMKGSLIANWWIKLCRFHFDSANYMEGVKEKDIGQFNHIIKACGADTIPILQMLVRDWKNFRTKVVAFKGGSSLPIIPQHAIILVHIDIAKQFYKDKQKIKVKKPELPLQLIAETLYTPTEFKAGLGKGSTL